MSVTYKGLKGPVLQTEQHDYDPERGLRVSQEFEGSPDLIHALAATFRQDGFRYQLFDPPGPYSKIIVFGRDLDITESPVRWTLTTAVVQTDLFSLPSIAIEMEASGNPSGYRKSIENARDAGSATITDPVALTSAVALNALRELRYGTTHFNDTHLILRRRETISASVDVAAKMRLDLTKYIYSTAQLGIPTNVPFILPDPPSEVRPNAQWGWLFMGSELDTDGVTTDRVHEFSFYAWSTIIYTPATGNFIYA